MPPKKKPTKNLSKKQDEISSESEESEDSLKSSEKEELSDEIALNTESEIDECDLEQMIEDDNEYFNNDQTSEIQVETKQNIVTGKNRKTNPRLTKYEMVRIIGERTKQLVMGAKPLVKNYQDLAHEQIAIEELKNNMIPFKIKRPMPNNSIEIWELNELSKNHLNLN
tara:strand:- start:3114 stop:3617 length:504 start_codon:yes stop_codon:yes gene_type:complete